MTEYGEHKHRGDRWVATGNIPKRMLNNRGREYAPPRWGSNKGHLPLNETSGDPSGWAQPKSEMEALMMAEPLKELPEGPTIDIESVRAELEAFMASLDERDQRLFHLLWMENLSWQRAADQLVEEGYECTKWQARGFERKHLPALKERFGVFL